MFFGWLIYLGVVSGLACDVVDFGWLELSLLIDVFGVLGLGDGGAMWVVRVVFGMGLRSVWRCVGVMGWRMDWHLFLGCVRWFGMLVLLF